MQAHVADGPNPSSVAPAVATERFNPTAAALVAGAVAIAVDDAAVVLSSAGPPTATTATGDERRDSHPAKTSEGGCSAGHKSRHSEHLDVNPVPVAMANTLLGKDDLELDALGDGHSPPAVATTLLSAGPPITGGTEEHSGKKEKGTSVRGSRRVESRVMWETGSNPNRHVFFLYRKFCFRQWDHKGVSNKKMLVRVHPARELKSTIPRYQVGAWEEMG